MKQQSYSILQGIFKRNTDNFYGYDPYDALESEMFIAKSSFKILKLVLVQIIRISPINLRDLLSIPTTADPKAAALFALSSLLAFDKCKETYFAKKAQTSLSFLIKSRSSKSSRFSIAQNRRQQMLEYSAEEGYPGHFITVLAGECFLKAYQIFQKKRYLNKALSIGEYFINEAPRDEYGEDKIYFHYKPEMGVTKAFSNETYNLSALIGSYLVRLSQENGSFSPDIGHRALNYICQVQNDDGSWFYSRKRSYIDNFHTGFILLALSSANEILHDKNIDKTFQVGLHYFKKKLLKKEGKVVRPIHFDPAHLPFNSNLLTTVDIRDCAVSIILTSYLSKKGMCSKRTARKLVEWTLENMWNEEKFFFEKTWLWTNKINYISMQAWMALALATFHRYLDDTNEN